MKAMLSFIVTIRRGSRGRRTGRCRCEPWSRNPRRSRGVVFIPIDRVSTPGWRRKRAQTRASRRRRGGGLASDGRRDRISPRSRSPAATVGQRGGRQPRLLARRRWSPDQHVQRPLPGRGASASTSLNRSAPSRTRAAASALFDRRWPMRRCDPAQRRRLQRSGVVLAESPARGRPARGQRAEAPAACGRRIASSRGRAPTGGRRRLCRRGAASSVDAALRVLRRSAWRQRRASRNDAQAHCSVDGLYAPPRPRCKSGRGLYWRIPVHDSRRQIAPTGAPPWISPNYWRSRSEQVCRTCTRPPGRLPMIRVDGDVRRINIPAFDHKQVHALVMTSCRTSSAATTRNSSSATSFEIPGLPASASTP